MKPIRFRSAATLVVLGGMLAFAVPARAQVQMNCVPVPVPSAYPSDWRSSNSLCRLTLTNNLAEPIRCDLRARLEQTGGAALTSEPRVFAPGQTVLLTQQILDWGRLAFEGSVDDAMKRTGHLPAKPITVRLFCENMVGANSGVSIPDVQIQITILPSIPPPPTLLTPRNTQELHTPAPIFTWTPVRLTTGTEAWYQFRMVRILPGQDAERALEANVPVLETFVRRSSLPYPSAAPRFEDGAAYAWRVQAMLNVDNGAVVAVGTNGLIVVDAPTAGRMVGVGLNEGRSPVYSFVWSSDAATSVARRAGPTGGVAGPLGDASRVAGDGPAPPNGGARRTWRRTVTPTDSIALELLRPRDDWWGPVRGDRPTATSGPAAASDATTGTPTGGEPAPAGTTAAASTKPTYGPMALQPDVPAGAGVALPWFRLSGTSVAAGEVYAHTGAGLAARPDRTGQFAVGAEVSLLGDRVKVPVRALVSGDQVSFRQTINQLALHPRFAWGALHAGNVRPTYSHFSLSDATVLGGGGDIVRDHWYAGGVVGRMRQAVRRDTVNPTEPQFERNVVAGRIGWGRALGDAVELVVMRVLDDEGSLPGDTLLRVTPAGNTVVEARARRAVLDSSTTVQVDAAMSRFDRNVQADAPTVQGFAASVQVVRRVAGGDVGAAVDYTGGGFQTLGNSQIAPDRVEGRLHATRMAHDGRLRVGGTLGLRRDDLSGTLGGETRRRTLGTQVGWQPLPLFGVDMDLNVQASHSPGTEFRQELSDLTASFNAAPRLAWTWMGHPHNFSASVGAQSVEFGEIGALGLAESRTTTVTCGWQAGLSNTLFAQLSGTYVRSVMSEQVTEIGSWGPGLGLTLLGGRVQANVQLQVSQTHLLGYAVDRDLLPDIDARWQVKDRQSLVFRAGWRRYRTGANTFGDFDERQATLQYSAAL